MSLKGSATREHRRDHYLFTNNPFGQDTQWLVRELLRQWRLLLLLPARGVNGARDLEEDAAGDQGGMDKVGDEEEEVSRGRMEDLDVEMGGHLEVVVEVADDHRRMAPKIHR